MSPSVLEECGVFHSALSCEVVVGATFCCLVAFCRNPVLSTFSSHILDHAIYLRVGSSIHLPFRFPTECFPVLREKIPGVVESLRKFVSSGVLDESIPDCIVVIMKVYSQETYLLSQYKDLFALLLQLFLPDQEVLVAEFAS